MGSVLDYCKCKQCGYNYATPDYYYKSDEEYIYCSRCGYTYLYHIKYEDKEMVLKSDGKPEYEEKEEFGFGAFNIKNRRGFGSLGGFRNKNDALGFQKEFKRFKKSGDRIVYLSKADGSDVEVIIDKRDWKPEDDGE